LALRFSRNNLVFQKSQSKSILHVIFTTRDASFPECQMHSGKGQKHSGKPSPSATLGEEPPGMSLTGKRPSLSAKNRTLGEAFPECRPSTRGSFDTVGAVHPFFLKPLSRVQQGKKFVFFKKNSSPSVALGEEFCFFKKNPLPRVLILGTRGRILAAVFNKTLFPECHCLGTRGSHVFF
jgi:hypothetical protein